MSVISSNLSALAHASFPSQRLDAIPVLREDKPSSQMPPVEASSASSNASGAHNGPQSTAESKVEAAAREDDQPKHALSANENEYRGITNMNAVDENGKFLNLRLPLVDEFPDRPPPKIGT